MLNTTVKRSRELERGFFCLGFFSWRKPNLSYLILLGKVVRRNHGAHSSEWHITKTSQEITSVSSTGVKNLLCAPLQSLEMPRSWKEPPLLPKLRRARGGGHLLLRLSAACLPFPAIPPGSLTPSNKKILFAQIDINCGPVRLGTGGLSLWVCLFIYHLFFPLCEQLSLHILNTVAIYE